MVVEIYNTPICTTYKSYIFSKTTIFNVLSLSMAYVATFLVVYPSHDFWRSMIYDSEQPTVNFKSQMILQLDTTTGSKVWSTFPTYNQINSDNLVFPEVSTQEFDTDSDGKKDSLNVILSTPGITGASGIRLIMGFSYTLTDTIYFNMNSLAILDSSYSRESKKVTAFGQLSLLQKSPLNSRVPNNIYQAPIFNETAAGPNSFDIPSILLQYSQRNLSTVVDDTLYVWESGTSDSFTINATISYPVTRISIKAPFWYQLKFAWIQYLAVLIIFLIIVMRVRRFVFCKQIFHSIIVRPSVDCKLQCN